MKTNRSVVLVKKQNLQRNPHVRVLPDPKPMDLEERKRQILSRFVEASGLIHENRAIVQQCHKEMKALYGKGQHPGFTIYSVKKTTVKRHTRKGYTAVRGSSRS